MTLIRAIALLFIAVILTGCPLQQSAPSRTDYTQECISPDGRRVVGVAVLIHGHKLDRRLAVGDVEGEAINWRVLDSDNANYGSCWTFSWKDNDTAVVHYGLTKGETSPPAVVEVVDFGLTIEFERRTDWPISNRALIANWIRARDALGFEMRTSAALEVLSGQGPVVPLLLPGFGAPKGMVIVTDHSDVASVADVLRKSGYLYSVASELPTGEEYDRAVFVDILSKWGWSGDPRNKPAWLKDAGQ